ncbi:T9SS type A sorting domain-containing protein [Dyadobacter sp. CY312]|uniref:T9SS type A sorting domain-containing protein n=1 Tax=Dyadobacter sp. CY312 TaxID=2907303 RepID=UPI001F352F7B|nr:T9SS type A sorting domain-containing protein [Dyadobacter sp. CY312]MCE7044251.1 T9SS type A sorting domain-containing protein [Dyadobacter sp. CY312]
MKTFYNSWKHFSLLLILIYLITTISYAQNCPSLPGGYHVGAFGGSSHDYLFPGAVPSGSPAGSIGGKTIGYFNFPNQNITFANRKSITISPTLDGSSNGKVIFNLWKLSFNSGTSLKIYSGDSESGTLVDDINTSNFASKVGQEYIVDGTATIVFYGSTPNVSNNNIIRFLTGDILIQTCNQGRSGLVWKEFIAPNSYVIVDDQESQLENLSTPSYNFFPACMAYFDQNRNFVRVESAFCLDQSKWSPSPGYWFYPGEYQYTLNSTSNYDVDRDGFNASVDNLKTARILWLIRQADGATYDVKGDIQLGIWRTQSNPINNTFTPGSWEAQAQTAVPTIPSPPEPTFSMSFPSGETGEDIVNTGTIQVEIPFSWSSVQSGQTNVVKIEIPTGVTIQSVTGGTLSGTNLTITAAVATLTLSSSTVGEFFIKAIYDNPLYYNINNLQVYKPCSASLESQEFLHIGEENIASPFRSISVKWIQDPLPVRLVKFDVSLENKNALLQWKTADEVDFSHFEIEKSSDAKKWNAVSNVGSNPIGNYQFVDSDIAAMKTIYYRLKMVDNDNSYAYSSIKSLVAKNLESLVSLYPNPVSTVLNISNLDMENVNSVKIYDQFGMLKLDLGALMHNNLEIGSLTNGLYIIHFNLKNGASLSQKIIVKK